MFGGIEAVLLFLAIAEVKVRGAFQFACEVKYFAIALQHFVLICPEFSERPYMGRFIENGCSPLVSVQCSLPDFLTEVQHKWSREEEGGNGKGAIAALCASGKPGGCNPLFIVILKEIEQRDYQDTHREVAPLKMTRDSVKLDTSDMNIDEVITAMKDIIAKKVGQ